MDVLPAAQENCYRHRPKTGTFSISDSHSTSYPKNDRAGGIRTHDLLNPIQAHYQAVLRPDSKEAKDAAPGWLFQAGKSASCARAILYMAVTSRSRYDSQFANPVAHFGRANSSIHEIRVHCVDNSRNYEATKIEHQTVCEAHN
jgi:hypothetical protein